jgi:hypothetical protein
MYFFEKESWYVAPAVLKFAFPCLGLLTAGIIGEHHNTQ